jgi:glycosyltransferase involved in cell wall biosynthesis
VLKKLFLDWPVKRLRYITTISQATKDEIVFQTNCDPEKIRVIHNPLFEEFQFTESKPFDKTCPTILQIGYTKNKNIPNLVAAIEGLSCRLVVVGRIDDDLRHLLNESSVNCEIKSDLRVRQLADEYRNADIVAFCSTYEGFGLPIIEGQALGKPVVTSDQRPMNDVAGGGAILVDPYDVASIRAGILRVIEDDKLRNELIKKGFENVRRFQPDVIAAMYENFYAEILNNTDSSR